MNKLRERTEYKFRIQATNDAGTGPFSEIFSFSTTAQPPPVVKGSKCITILNDDSTKKDGNDDGGHDGDNYGDVDFDGDGDGDGDDDDEGDGDGGDGDDVKVMVMMMVMEMMIMMTVVMEVVMILMVMIMIISSDSKII